MEKPFFSIVITTYNRSSNLIKIIKKFINTQFKIEIIICDSQSKDHTKEKVFFIKSNYRHLSIKYIDVKKNNNSKKRNEGIKSAIGKNIILLDDDCIPEGNFLKKYKILFDLLKNNKAVICGSVEYNFNSHNRNFIKYRASRHFKLNNDKNFYKNFLIPKNIVTMNMGFKKNLIKKKLFFDERFNKYGFEDYEFGYRLSKENIKIIPASPLVTHLDDRDFESFLKKIKYIALKSSIYLNRINFKAAKENNFIKLENNFLFKKFYKIKFLFELFRILEKIFIFIDKNFVYLPFIYKISIAIAYFQGCYLRNSKIKGMSYLQNWYK